jgi:hypothetical protein
MAQSNGERVRNCLDRTINHILPDIYRRLRRDKGSYDNLQYSLIHTVFSDLWILSATAKQRQQLMSRSMELLDEIRQQHLVKCVDFGDGPVKWDDVPPSMWGDMARAKVRYYWRIERGDDHYSDQPPLDLIDTRHPF